MRCLACTALILGLIQCTPGASLGDPEDASTDAEAVRVCAAGTMTLGVDVTHHQGEIDWASTAASSVKFVYVRAGDGLAPDTRFTSNWAGAAGAGVLRGAYQSLRPSQDPVAQAEAFLAALESNPLLDDDLPPAVMIASDGSSSAKIKSSLATWISVVEAATKRRVLIKTNAFVGSPLGDAFEQHPLWVMNYTQSPSLPAGWDDWSFWQYTDSGSFDGLELPANGSRFNGTIEDLKEFAASSHKSGGPADPTPPAPGSVWTPAPGTTWQWQLVGSIDTSYDVQAYDVDLFETPASTLSKLKSDGRKVICYFSAGTYEEGRPDSAAFPASVIGNVLDDWPGERWLDTRSAVVRGLMKSRLDLAVTRGCDAVEPDNVDGYSNNPGFALTAATQLDFNKFLAKEAHARGLSIGLKNDMDQVAALVDDFDWALNEECYAYEECGVYEDTFVAKGKAVFHAEYVAASKLASVCAVTKPLQLSTLIKHLDLDAWQKACP